MGRLSVVIVFVLGFTLSACGGESRELATAEARHASQTEVAAERTAERAAMQETMTAVAGLATKTPRPTKTARPTTEPAVIEDATGAIYLAVLDGSDMQAHLAQRIVEAGNDYSIVATTRWIESVKSIADELESASKEISIATTGTPFEVGRLVRPAKLLGGGYGEMGRYARNWVESDDREALDRIATISKSIVPHAHAFDDEMEALLEKYPISLPERPSRPEPISFSDPPTTIPQPTAIPQPVQAAPPAGIPDYNPDEDRNCDEFPGGHAEAQAWWDYYRTADRPNPGRLDGDGDGLICEEGASGSAPPTEVPAPAAPSITCSGARTCNTFNTHAEAQAYWEACGRPSKMDRDNDGSVCESLP